MKAIVPSKSIIGGHFMPINIIALYNPVCKPKMQHTSVNKIKCKPTCSS